MQEEQNKGWVVFGTVFARSYRQTGMASMAISTHPTGSGRGSSGAQFWPRVIIDTGISGGMVGRSALQFGSFHLYNDSPDHPKPDPGGENSETRCFGRGDAAIPAFSKDGTRVVLGGKDCLGGHGSAVLSDQSCWYIGVIARGPGPRGPGQCW